MHGRTPGVLKPGFYLFFVPLCLCVFVIDLMR